ncbi:MAG TPA: PKD domain-containing protein [Mycobacteriales bacterium]|nr:PKD domain-containing protein [Mycobacteriales bacterium]
MRFHPVVSSGIAVGAAATITVLTAATAVAATPKAASAAPKHPVAALSVSTSKPAVGTDVVANASRSRLPKGDVLRKAKVTFGDGTAISLANLKTRASHAYAKPGTFNVVLTIVDRHGVKVTKSKSVTVHAAPAKTPPASSGLPVTVPSGVTSKSLISSLGLSSATLSSVASRVGIPASTLTDLPVGFLGLLPGGDLTGATLPSLPGLSGLPTSGDLVSLLESTLGGLPFSLPTGGGLTGSQLIGSVPSTVLSAVQLSTLSTLFGVPTSVLSGLPLSILSLLPGNLVQIVASTGLPISIPAGLSPDALISSLGLSSTALSSISSLTGIASSTLGGLPVGFLSLLPVSDLTGAGLPSLPGLSSLPIVGNLLGELLAGLPISVPATVSPSTLISALPAGVLSALQLDTLSTFLGVPTSVLSTLPVNVVTLLPTGLFSGL